MKNHLFARMWQWMCLLLLCSLPVTALAQEEEPMAVFHTNAYIQNGENNAISILIGSSEKDVTIEVDCGNGRQQYDVLPSTLNSETGTWDGTFITCNVSSQGVVKLYGDPSKIDVLMGDGCYFTDIDISKLTNLAILSLTHNEITELDLTEHTKLNALYLDDNPFNKKPLIVGANKPNLLILEMAQMDGLDESFNLSDYPKLRTFDAMSNRGLKRLDPTGCPYLQKISIDSTPVKELDVTKNPNLMILNISDTGIKNIDLSKNENLTQFYADHQSSTVNPGVKLASLDVTKNPNLMYLFAAGNDLTEIDVTKNPYLNKLYLSNNNLKEINLDNNNNLDNVILRNNYLTFATLPLPRETWVQYDYFQKEMAINTSILEGSVIDFSDKVLREGYETECALFMVNDEDPSNVAALDETYFTFENGKVTLLKATPHPVYLAFACNAFPDLTLNYMPLRTNKFRVKTEATFGQDEVAAVITLPSTTQLPLDVELKVGMEGAKLTSPKKFYVDFGDGVKQAFNAFVSNNVNLANVKGTAKGKTITIYVPEDQKMSSLGIDGIKLQSIDLSNSRNLTNLSLTGTGLKAIDLGWNYLLKELTLTGNNFGTLNIRGVNDAFQKNLLQTINLSDNNLTEVTLNDNFTIHHLNLSHNKLTQLSFKDADMMETLDLSYNQLKELNLNYSTQLRSLNVAGNQINSIIFAEGVKLENLDVSSNAFDFSTLPSRSLADTYTYAPQNDIVIPHIGPGVDLSTNNLNGVTNYVWKRTADDSSLTLGTDYTVQNGQTRFLSPVFGTSVYGLMTNATFPGLTLRTSSIEAAGMPTHLLATMQITEASQGQLIMTAKSPATNIFIDWKGDGVELHSYIVGNTATGFEVSATKAATAKVYAYDASADLTVFSITGIKMSEVDLTPLPNLICATVRDAGLNNIILPKNAPIIEINLDGNNLKTVDFTAYPDLVFLALNNNKLEAFDASPYQNLQVLGLIGNDIKTLTLNNPKMWSLSASDNEISEIDFTNAKNLDQIAIDGNLLTSIDITKLNSLRVLFIDRNKFKFSTLPVGDHLSLFTYADQYPLEATVNDGRVDLSSEAEVRGEATTYRWYLNYPDYDENGELVGEELYVDDEYMVKNGVTTFLVGINDVVCILTNPLYPNLVLFTPLMNIPGPPAGIHDAQTTASGVKVEGNSIVVNAPAGKDLTICSASGVLLRKTKTVGGVSRFTLPTGAYVVTVGEDATKVVVK